MAVTSNPQPALQASSSGPSRGVPALRRFLTAHLSSAAWGIGGILLVLIIWQAVVLIGNMPEATLPTPIEVARQIGSQSALLWSATLVTLREVVLGFLLAAIVGVPLAVAIAFCRPVERLVYPLLIISNAVPKVALAPVLLVWFGFGDSMKEFLAFVIALFPIVINSVLGFQTLDVAYARLGAIMGASHWRMFWKIRLPSAAASIFVGLKLGVTLATTGAVVGEFVAAKNGLGYLAQVGAGQVDTVLTFAAIVVMAAVGILLFYLVCGVEAVVLRSHSDGG